MSSKIKAGRPSIVYFREAFPGDVLKLKAESNISQTGGGARDLRVRPANKFDEVMLQIFTEPTEKPGVFQQVIHWESPNTGHVKTATAEYWRPTEVRPNESRIARIHELDCWAIDEAAYVEDRKKSVKWFFLLVLDNNGLAWARLVRESAIPEMNQTIRAFFQKRITSCTLENKTICGAIDLPNNKEYP